MIVMDVPCGLVTCPRPEEKLFVPAEEKSPYRDFKSVKALHEKKAPMRRMADPMAEGRGERCEVRTAAAIL